LNNRREREDKKELQQQEVDRQESEFRKSQRIEAIEKANDLLYEQTDKMKFLRTQQHYADVLVYRKQQMDEKKGAINKERGVDRDYHELTMKQIQESERKENEETARKEAIVKMVAQSRAEQLDEARQRKARAEEEARLLGLALKSAAEERVKEDIAVRNDKAAEIREGRMRTLEKNAELRDERKRLELVEEEAERERGNVK
jgi:hypothetical protein